jgi:hypothetical protein
VLSESDVSDINEWQHFVLAWNVSGRRGLPHRWGTSKFGGKLQLIYTVIQHVVY